MKSSRRIIATVVVLVAVAGVNMILFFRSALSSPSFYFWHTIAEQRSLAQQLEVAFKSTTTNNVTAQQRANSPKPKLTVTNSKLGTTWTQVSTSPSSSWCPALKSIEARKFTVMSKNSARDAALYYRQGRRRPLKNKAVGLLYVKVHKSASSTTAGVALRIASQVARRAHPLQEQQRCPVMYHHSSARQLAFSKRLTQNHQSYLWSMVRHPNSRALSQFFFYEMSIWNQPYPGDEMVKKYLQNTHVKGKGGYQLDYLTTTAYNDIALPHHHNNGTSTEAVAAAVAAAEDAVHALLQTYNFLGVAERYDESVVALRLLLHLDPADVLYFSSKISGDGMYGGWLRCFPVVKPFASDFVKEYMDSEDWWERTVGDLILYQAANRSLDATIDHVIGRETFNQALKEHERLMQKVQQECRDKVVYPCSKVKTTLEEREEISKEHCYEQDWGCGYKCIDRVVTKDKEERGVID